MSSDPMAYLGRKRCGCVVAVVVDEGPSNSDYVAEATAEFIRDGLTLERVSIAVARKSLTFCQCGKSAAQGDLFEKANT